MFENTSQSTLLSGIAVASALYVSFHYATRAYEKRQERKHNEEFEAAIAKANATLNDIAKMFPQEFNL